MSVLIALILGKVDQNLNSPNLFSSHFILFMVIFI